MNSLMQGQKIMYGRNAEKMTEISEDHPHLYGSGHSLIYGGFVSGKNKEIQDQICHVDHWPLMKRNGKIVSISNHPKFKSLCKPCTVFVALTAQEAERFLVWLVSWRRLE